MEATSHVVVWGIIVLFGALTALVLWKIHRNEIRIDSILVEGESAKASLSRFQFMFFTFLVGGLWLFLCVKRGEFVALPDSALILMGISSGTYVLSKGIAQGAGAAPPEASPASATRTVIIEPRAMPVDFPAPRPPTAPATPQPVRD